MTFAQFYASCNVLWCRIILQNSSSPSRANHTQFQSTASQPQTSADDRPRHRNFASEQRRVESFRGVQVPRGQSVEVLAKAGFFHVGQ